MKITALGITIFSIYLAISAVIAFATEYTIEFWASYTGNAKDIPYFAAFLISLIPGIGQIWIAAYAVTLVLSYVLVYP